MTFLLLPTPLHIFLGHTATLGPRKVLTVMTALVRRCDLDGTISSYATMLVGRVLRGTAEGPFVSGANRYIRTGSRLGAGRRKCHLDQRMRAGMTVAVLC